jgi:hypothetical protein
MPFPSDDYTPYGYLDIPTHTRNLTPRGVARSFDAGFRWHYPAYPGMYGGGREIYRAGLRVGIGGALALAEFAAATSPYHSKNLCVFDLKSGDASVRIEYQLVGEHAIHAKIATHQATRITIHVEYARLLAANGEWGESGLAGRMEDGVLILQGFEDGDAFALWASRPASDIGISPQPAEAAGWAATPPTRTPEAFVAVVGRRGAQLALHGVLGFDLATGETTSGRGDDAMSRAGDELHRFAASPLEVILARGRTAEQARRHLDQARQGAGAERARKLAEDDAFWSGAPRLEGDWPEHWRRGLVYDLETLRMMVKSPVGIYRHSWDAMQIQAPRVVLAEAAFDALLLAYADPRLAQELLLGTFLDAPAPNVPCSREDGSYTMVAADGSVCGTAPAWGYPFLALEWLYELRPDRTWLERIYPRLAEYVDWWLSARRAPDGWLFYACSWESGQDDSPRFGAQPLGGGHPVRHIRPVDLHAALAHAAIVLAGFAATLRRRPDEAKWSRLAEEFSARTYQLWDGARYADFDTQAGRLTPVDDIMLLAPLALRLPALRPLTARAIDSLDADELIWPMNAWTAVEAALAADMPGKAAELSASVCERVYRCWDARLAHPDRTLPGIACEYWPLDGRCGGEGYGWGAFTTHLLLHALVGITPARDALHIRPNLPPDWRVPGRQYILHLHWRERPLAITIAPLDAERAIVTVNRQQAELGWGQALAVDAI